MTDFFSSTPDGKRYRAIADGQRVPMPFHLRWLIPTLCPNDLAWIITTALSLTATCALTAEYTHHWQAIPILLGLSGVVWFNIHHPILVDTASIALALASTISAQHGWWVAAIGFALVSGMAKETGPIYAAAWAWNPLPLIGLAAPAIRRLCYKPGPDTFDDEATHAQTNLRTVLIAHRKRQNLTILLLPWGACVLGFAHPTLQLGVICALAYGQLAVATDTVRLYQSAMFPVLIARTLTVVSPEWWVPMILLHLANPYRGSGL